MDVNWPSTLPQHMERALSYAPMSGQVRTNMSVGAPRVRRTTSAVPELVQCSWQMSGGELRIFRNFFKNTIHEGALEFGFKLYTDKEISSSYIKVRFTGPYVATLVSVDLWRVSGTLEVMDPLPVT